MSTQNFLIIFFTLLLFGCDSSSSQHNLSIKINPSNISKQKKHHSYIAYHYEMNHLRLTHHNVPFNCSLASIESHVSIDEELIKVQEQQRNRESTENLCLYDIEITLEEIEPQAYILDYNEGESLNIYFTIDLLNKTEGIRSY